jgi:bifunctional DNA-binding transcriptional regulator/antitoxin component of YhaV-PrlF toxin-antitoxin module
MENNVTILQMVKLLGKPRPIDGRNRVTLPPEVLKLLDLKPNDEVFFKVDKDKIIIGKALIKYKLIDEIIGGKK